MSARHALRPSCLCASPAYRTIFCRSNDVRRSVRGSRFAASSSGGNPFVSDVPSDGSSRKDDDRSKDLVRRTRRRRPIGNHLSRDSFPCPAGKMASRLIGLGFFRDALQPGRNFSPAARANASLRLSRQLGLLIRLQRYNIRKLPGPTGALYTLGVASIEQDFVSSLSKEGLSVGGAMKCGD